jgi:universal stress protein E
MPKHILVAIKDPHGGRTPSLQRAQEWAVAHQARVTVFHSLYIPAIATANFYLPKQQQMDIAAAVEQAKRALQQLAKPLIAAGVAVQVRVRWDHPVHESVVREVGREKIDLLMLDSYRHGALARLVLSNTDWQVLRLCPCPVLLVKSRKPHARSVMAVSVDPLHANDKPAALDHLLIEQAQHLAAPFKAAVHVVHFYQPLLPLPMGMMIEPVVLPSDLFKQHVKRVKLKFAELTQAFKLGPRHTHLQVGTASEDLPRVVQKLKATVLVMGAISRSGLKRLFIGATAEQVIDQVTCDVLIIKPAGFKTPVPAKAPRPPVMLPPL